MTCCFTGHRPKDLSFGHDESAPLCVALKQRLYALVLELIEQRGISHFITGMAMGIDSFAAEAVLQAKQLHPAIRLEAALPFPDHSRSWPEPHRLRHLAILEQCDLVTPVSPGYTPYCFHQRNRYMLAQAGTLLAVWNGADHGGTFYTLSLARKQKKDVVLLHLPELSVSYQSGETSFVMHKNRKKPPSPSH